MIPCIATTDPTPGSVSPFIQDAGNMLNASRSAKSGFHHGSFRLYNLYFNSFIGSYERIVKPFSMRENTLTRIIVRNIANHNDRRNIEASINSYFTGSFKMKPTGMHIAKYQSTLSDFRTSSFIPGDYFTV
jgi:hypothetical protein